MFGAGAVVYALSYALFALGSHSVMLLLVTFLTSGMGIGFAETAESATVARALPDRLRSTASACSDSSSPSATGAPPWRPG